METVKGNSGKKNFLVKTWKRCRSFPHNRHISGGVSGFSKSKSWHGKEGKKKVPLEGCFPVYVGPEKYRFAVKTKYANHPLFTMLLEDAETEYGYGYKNNGPISLPCDVDLFYKVLAEMEAKEVQPHGCGFVYASCSPFNPGRRLGNNGVDWMARGFGSYELLVPLKSMKMN